jgi:uncharacterized protein YecE (DUF72 family)
MLRIGVAGFDYRDWIGYVYPNPLPKPFDRLAYLARYVDVVEINSSFYGPPKPSSTARWLRSVAGYPAFRFTAKLWRRFTHERDSAWTAADLDLVRAGLSPLAEGGKLGCLLAQFPWSFKREPASEEWLGDLVRAFAEFRLVVEVRHSSWNQPEFYRWLAGTGTGIVNIDQPLFAKSIGPAARATAAVGYVRLHGRNYANWFRAAAEPHERYNYLYTQEELAAWAERIQSLDRQVRELYVVTNNHHQGKELVGAAMLRTMITGRPATVPPPLEAAYHDALAPLGIREGGGIALGPRGMTPGDIG